MFYRFFFWGPVTTNLMRWRSMSKVMSIIVQIGLRHHPASSKWPFDHPNGGHLTPEKGHLTIPKRSLWITRTYWFSGRKERQSAKISCSHGSLGPCRSTKLLAWQKSSTCTFDLRVNFRAKSSKFKTTTNAWLVSKLFTDYWLLANETVVLSEITCAKLLSRLFFSTYTYQCCFEDKHSYFVKVYFKFRSLEDGRNNWSHYPILAKTIFPCVICVYWKTCRRNSGRKSSAASQSSLNAIVSLRVPWMLWKWFYERSKSPKHCRVFNGQKRGQKWINA